jgi:hypothetical protein
MVNWIIDNPVGGSQPVLDTSTTARHPLGMLAKAHDADSTTAVGYAELMYVQASNSVAQYDAVAIKESGKIAPLTLTNAQTAVEIGFSQIANGVKDTYMWVWKGGRPIVKCALATQPNLSLYATATGGVLTSLSTSVMIQGVIAVTQVTNSAGQSTCVARYPVVKRVAEAS